MAARHTVAMPEALGTRRSLGLRVVLGTAVTTTILGSFAYLLHEPFVFPSLGPAMFLLFFSPLATMSAPRNAIVGQSIGLGSGYLSLVVFRLREVPPDIFDVSLLRVAAVIFALTLAFGLMVGLGFPHAPAGATAMIVALGIINTPLDLCIMMLAVLIVTLSAFAINRLAGIDVPVWSPRAQHQAKEVP